ncbi:MAG: cytochrome oxidase subunit [Phenylobacterium sp.]|jgi:uncharacterized membrane protein|uniref:DUF2189 domain-containing protein n=1 Tax=Phenylobacterium sp. TaxID=1871053 RepID=UPI0026042C63|nr:DUF2189 domain-containing protein [Phenylobacterium sp.]MDB5428339.1 cytochrome oxidase subunit [Phenylobacterium sp.]MDB5434692.1 cytochrome oxidase subunit [Phenylobacterium sp.]MDB5497324.1 cytochrome oxidase subunit [Phenylobacterium sp.]
MAAERPSENHVENPFEFFLEKLGWAVSDVGRTMLPRLDRHVGQAIPAVRRIGAADLWDALRKGMADVGATRDDVLFIGLIYPLAGLVLARLAFSLDLLPLLFPLASGFAIIGPFAAVGLYELSRRREQGLPVTWLDAFGVFKSPAIGSILGLGAVLLVLFFVWLGVAWEIYLATLGGAAPQTVGAFERSLFTTGGGWTMIAAGIGVGFLFAVFAFAISVVSFPLLLDRDVGMTTAVRTSLRAFAANPGTMILWGAIVAVLLVLGSIPALVGLIFVVPLLGHASWHLYRKVVGEADA